jgi:dTMP kinase
MGGLLIVFEGPDGAGKSTQTRRLAERLEGDGFDVLVTREPGGTRLGDRLRGLLLEYGDHEVFAETEALLYAADRAQHVREVLRPALERGAVVVCDRYVDSSLAYQGGGRGLPVQELTVAQHLATGGLLPDLRLLLDLPVAVGLERRFSGDSGVNRLDTAGASFHDRVRVAYHNLVARAPEDWAVLDADRSVDEVASEVWCTVWGRVGARLEALRGQVRDTPLPLGAL